MMGNSFKPRKILVGWSNKQSHNSNTMGRYVIQANSPPLAVIAWHVFHAAPEVLSTVVIPQPARHIAPLGVKI